MPPIGRNCRAEKWLPRLGWRAACAPRVPASSWFTGLKAPKFDDDIPRFPVFQKLDRTLSCEGVAFRSQPSRNIRTLNRLLQKGPQFLKVPEMTWAADDSGPLPVLHCSQTGTEGMSEFRLGQSEVFTQLSGATRRRHVSIRLTGRSRST